MGGARGVCDGRVGDAEAAGRALAVGADPGEGDAEHLAVRNRRVREVGLGAVEQTAVGSRWGAAGRARAGRGAGRGGAESLDVGLLDGDRDRAGGVVLRTAAVRRAGVLAAIPGLDPARCHLEARALTPPKRQSVRAGRESGAGGLRCEALEGCWEGRGGTWLRRNWQRRKVMLESQVHAQSGSMSTPAEGPVPQVLDRTVSSTTTSRPLVIVKALRSAAAMGPRREQAARAEWEGSVVRAARVQCSQLSSSTTRAMWMSLTAYERQMPSPPVDAIVRS